MKKLSLNKITEKVIEGASKLNPVTMNNKQRAILAGGIVGLGVLAVLTKKEMVKIYKQAEELMEKEELLVKAKADLFERIKVIDDLVEDDYFNNKHKVIPMMREVFENYKNYGLIYYKLNREEREKLNKAINKWFNMDILSKDEGKEIHNIVAAIQKSSANPYNNNPKTVSDEELELFVQDHGLSITEPDKLAKRAIPWVKKHQAVKDMMNK